MKRLMIFCVAGLAVLWAGNVGLAKDKSARQESRKTMQENKQERQKIRATAAEERPRAVARIMVRRDLLALRRMRATAVEEGARRTVAQIDKAIAVKERQGKRLTAGGAKKDANPAQQAAKRHRAEGRHPAIGKKGGHRQQ